MSGFKIVPNLGGGPEMASPKTLHWTKPFLVKLPCKVRKKEYCIAFSILDIFHEHAFRLTILTLTMTEYFHSVISLVS